MLALDFLRVAFAWAVLVGVEVTRVGPPIIGIIAAQPEGLQQRFEPQKDLIFAAPKDVGPDLAGVVIDGMPEPAWVALVPDKRPHLIHLRLRFPSAFQVPSRLGGVQRAQYSGVHRLQRRFFLLEFPQHRVGTDMQRARRITYPTGIETHVDDHVLHLWQASAVAIVEQKTALGTQGVLAEVALGTPGRFPAFDNLVTLTVRAADGDERHGPFLPMRSYEDKAQCDIHLSPSPLLKHYPIAVRYNYHALLAGVKDLRRLTWMDKWHELAGYARIEPIESTAAVVRYVSKYVVKGGEIDMGGPLVSAVLPLFEAASRPGGHQAGSEAGSVKARVATPEGLP